MKQQLTSLRGVVCTFAGIALIAGCAGPKEVSETSPEAETQESEQVNIGYGTRARKDLTSSVASVSSEEIERSTAPTLAEMLRGRVAGLSVTETAGGGLQVRIRGVSSIYGSSEPLFIVDGVPITTGSGVALSSINPRDVASIDVLKDAAATAIYGSRGANGVILIRTKRGN